ncbi:hypothetical protein EVAR_7520_1 [Eumeta japonica]|uniref:Uncharacterized protein n=1 Tax=Eumeta variegata TaxID=151549 RepID=A0A4C2A9E2_EUMVA|nr:hypothetical protein EVAR_7520_1 [Eumeta japonica]
MSERCIAHGPRFNKITIGCTRPIQTGPRSVSADIKEMFLRVKIREKIETAYDSCGEITCTKIHKVPNDVTDFRRRLIALYCDLHQIATPQNLNEYPERAKRYD